MKINQLKTFVAVAREGSIVRSSERVALSQPAVSAHIKALEDRLGIALFERTARGMSLTSHGQRILDKAVQTLDAHRELFEEAMRIKGRVAGKLRLGVGGVGDSNIEPIDHLLRELIEHYPDVEVSLQHGNSLDTLNGILDGSLDAGFYNEIGEEPHPELATIEVSDFGVYLVAAPGLIATPQHLNWHTIGELPWVLPASSRYCCGKAAEYLFKKHNFRPKRIISIDRESVTRKLIAGGVGVGLMHTSTVREAQLRGEIDIVCEVHKSARVVFSHLARRVEDSLLSTASSILQEWLYEKPNHSQPQTPEERERCKKTEDNTGGLAPCLNK